MSAVVAIFANQLIVFTLVLARVASLVFTAPLFGQSAVPRRIRGLLAVALAALMTPLFANSSTPYPANLVEMALLVTNELLVGALLGLGISLLFTAVQVAGQLISQLSGMALADVFNPAFNASIPVFSQLLFFLTLAMLVCLGGHRLVLDALMDTFALMPPGSADLGTSFVDILTSTLTHSFALGIRAGAPVMTALLLSTLLLGLVSRTLPQINIIAVGFGLNALLTLGVFFLTLGAVAWTLQERTHDILDSLLEVFR